MEYTIDRLMDRQYLRYRIKSANIHIPPESLVKCLARSGIGFSLVFLVVSIAAQSELALELPSTSQVKANRTALYSS